MVILMVNLIIKKQKMQTQQKMLHLNCSQLITFPSLQYKPMYKIGQLDCESLDFRGFACE